MAQQILDAQAAVGYVQSNLYNIETQVYQTRYPDYDYAKFVPVVTEGAEWAIGTTFMSGDIAGKAEWFSPGAFDIPNADIATSQFTQSYTTAAIGFQYNMEEIARAQMAGRNLSAEKGVAARKVAEQMLYRIALKGDTVKGYQGLFNNASVATGTVAATGTGSSTLWSTKTQDQILNDINAAILGPFNASLEVEMVNTIVLPTGRFMNISSTARSSQGDTTTMKFLRENNVYTEATGQPLNIYFSRELLTAGSGGTARMVAYRKDPEVLRFHLPMPYRILPPEPMRALTTQVPGIFRTGGTEIRLPAAVNYYDGL